MTTWTPRLDSTGSTSASEMSISEYSFSRALACSPLASAAGCRDTRSGSSGVSCSISDRSATASAADVTAR